MQLFQRLRPHSLGNDAKVWKTEDGDWTALIDGVAPDLTRFGLLVHREKATDRTLAVSIDPGCYSLEQALGIRPLPWGQLTLGLKGASATATASLSEQSHITRIDFLVPQGPQRLLAVQALGVVTAAIQAKAGSSKFHNFFTSNNSNRFQPPSPSTTFSIDAPDTFALCGVCSHTRFPADFSPDAIQLEGLTFTWANTAGDRQTTMWNIDKTLAGQEGAVGARVVDYQMGLKERTRCPSRRTGGEVVGATVAQLRSCQPRKSARESEAHK